LEGTISQNVGSADVEIKQAQFNNRSDLYANYGFGRPSAFDIPAVFDIRAKAGAVIGDISAERAMDRRTMERLSFTNNFPRDTFVNEVGTSFFLGGEGCGRMLPSGYNEPHGHVHDEHGNRIK